MKPGKVQLVWENVSKSRLMPAFSERDYAGERAINKAGAIFRKIPLRIACGFTKNNAKLCVLAQNRFVCL